MTTRRAIVHVLYLTLAESKQFPFRHSLLLQRPTAGCITCAGTLSITTLKSAIVNTPLNMFQPTSLSQVSSYLVRAGSATGRYASLYGVIAVLFCSPSHHLWDRRSNTATIEHPVHQARRVLCLSPVIRMPFLLLLRKSKQPIPSAEAIFSHFSI